MHLRASLAAEFQRRRGRNPRYSLRAFARSLGTHHSTLSRVLGGRHRVTEHAIRRLGHRLGLTAAQIADACVAEHCASILRVVGDARFRPDSRRLASLTGIPLDDVNVALHWLLHQRRLVMATRDSWILLRDAS